MVKSRFIAISIFVSILAIAGFGQGGITRYVYDRNGRLRAVVSVGGEANVYDYDAAGNFTGIRRVSPTHVELFDFNPKIGVPGDQVTFTGVGFGAGVSSVAFTGAPAQGFTFNATTIIATVPAGTTNGPVTITTANGVVMTAEPFILAGVSVRPANIDIGTGDQTQFESTVFSPDPNQTVIWSVNGIVGGNSGVGTISTSGNYTAPSNPIIATVRATSVADPQLFGEAVARVISQDLKRFGASTGISIYKEVTPAAENNPVLAFSGGVSINKELPLIAENNPSIGIGRGVSINKEMRPEIENNPALGIGAGISINKEANQASENNPQIGIANGVSINKELSIAAENNPLTGIGRGISIAYGPYITSVSPAILNRGSAAAITVTGINFTGATTIHFADSTGLNTNIVVSNVTVNGDGTIITATVNVASNAAPGQRAVIITTPAGNSLVGGSPSNSVTIQ